MRRWSFLLVALLLPVVLNGCAVKSGPNAWEMIAWCILRGQFC